jgi:N-acetylmuramoyl-L-alanine amidase
MKRLLLSLAPWMVAIAAASGNDMRPAQVAFTYLGTTQNGALRVGDECFVEPEVVAAWGWTIGVRGNLADVQAEGTRFQLPLRSFNGNKHFSLQQALKVLNGGCAWRQGSDTIDVWGNIRELNAIDGIISVDSTIAGKPKVMFLKNPGRIVVDIQGVRIGPDTRMSLGRGARAQQFKPDTVRIVQEADLPNGAPKYREIATRKFEYMLGAVVTHPEAVPPDEPDDSERMDEQLFGPEKPVATTPTAKPTGAPSIARPPVLVEEKGNKLTIKLVLDKAPASPLTFQRIDPNKIEFKLPFTNFAGDDQTRLKTSFIEDWSVRPDNGASIFTFQTSRPMGLQVSTAGAETTIEFIRPSVGNGKLAGKTIVVDAGHGGHDTGAKRSNTLEKDLTLAIAKEVAEKLSAQGASVIMTRKTDVFIPLKERSEIANRNNSELFVSVHINSSAKDNKTSGGITFYHANDPIGQLLADCVQREIGKVSGLPSIGTWSDTRIYSTGFAVLRYAKMPAILIEMGFINHDSDRKRMTNPDFHQSVAKAIVKGIRIYLGDVKEEASDQQ